MASPRKKGRLTDFFTRRVAKPTASSGNQSEDETEEAAPSASAVVERQAEANADAPTRDISGFAKEAAQKGKLDDADKLTVLTDLWLPPKGYFFPKRAFGKEERRFNPEWLNLYKWLAYSPSDNGGYCLACVAFAEDIKEGVGKGGHQTPSAFVKSPWTRFKRTEQLQEHAKSGYHGLAAEKWTNFLSAAGGDNIAAQLDKVKKKEVKETKLYLLRLFQLVHIMGRQNMAFQSHGAKASYHGYEEETTEEPQDASAYKNPGNYLALIKHECEVDPVFRGYVESLSKRATYQSPTSQNQMITVIGDQILSRILASMEGKWFLVLVDGTTDVSRVEQTTLVLRFAEVYTVDGKRKAKVWEKFAGFLDAEEHTGEAYSRLVLSTLDKLGLSRAKCIGLGFDGASNMKGSVKGAQAKIREEIPWATYFHCQSHSLNLAVSDALKPFRNTSDVVKKIIVFVKASAIRVQKLHHFVQESINDGEMKPSKKKTLTSMCETRWCERHDAFIRFKEFYIPIVKTLDWIVANSSDRDAASTAETNLVFITTFDFIARLHILVYTSALILPLSKSLQSINMDILAALQQVTGLRQVVTKMLEDGSGSVVDADTDLDFDNLNQPFENLWKEIKAQADHDLVQSTPRLPRNSAYTCGKDLYLCSVWRQAARGIVAQLAFRFDDHVQKVGKLQGLVSAFYVPKKDIVEAVMEYEDVFPFPISQEEVEAEVELWENYWTTGPGLAVQPPPSSALEAAEFSSSQGQPIIRECLLLISSLPVSTSSAERSFSCLRRLKSHLRSTMASGRLTGLALQAVNPEVAVDYEAAVKTFLAMATRRKD